jgi:hypothetical protein
MQDNTAADAASLLSGLDDPEAIRKLTEAQNLLEKHYKLTRAEDPLDLAEKFVNSLIEMGATTNERLASLSYEEIQLGYVGHANKPVLLNKDIARIFRAGAPTVDQDGSNAIGRKKALSMSEKELVEAYSPRLSNPVADRLDQLSRKRPFVIIADDGSVLVEPTVKLLLELMDGHEPRKVYQHTDGIVYTPVCVGTGLPKMADENPLYPGMTLRDDGVCDQTNRSWASVPLELRQFARIAWGGKVQSLLEANTYLDRVIASLTHPEDKRLAFLSSYAMQGAAEFQTCKRLGTLPKLKLPLKIINVSGFTIQGKKV